MGERKHSHLFFFLFFLISLTLSLCVLELLQGLVLRVLSFGDFLEQVSELGKQFPVFLTAQVRIAHFPEKRPEWSYLSVDFSWASCTVSVKRSEYGLLGGFG